MQLWHQWQRLISNYHNLWKLKNINYWLMYKNQSFIRLSRSQTLYNYDKAQFQDDFILKILKKCKTPTKLG